LIELLLLHCNIDGKNTKVDIYCNKLKKFLNDYELITEEEKVVLEKKNYKRWKHTKEEIL
jgi:hypothetical protein